MGYSFIDLGDLSCAEIARQHSDLLLGHIAVNTSFDSGKFSCAEWTAVDPSLGSDGFSCADWREVNGYSFTPRINSALIEGWPVSHEEVYDEWWVFETAVPPTFKVNAFCNYGMPIGRYKELDWKDGVPLDSYLREFAPIAMFGNNGSAYLIR
jgi:hypothetical protein